MVNQLLENLNANKSKFESKILTVSDAISSINKISEIEKEIIVRVLEIKLLKGRLLNNPYISNKEDLSKLTSPEILALEKSIGSVDIEGPEEGIIEPQKVNEIEDLSMDDFDLNKLLWENGIDSSEVGLDGDVVIRGGLMYIGDNDVEDMDAVKDGLMYNCKSIENIIDDEEVKLHAERTIDASLDDAVEELEIENKEQQELKSVLNDVKKGERNRYRDNRRPQRRRK